MRKACREANRIANEQLAHGIAQEERHSPQRREELRLYMASQDGKESARNTRLLAERVADKELHAAFKQCDFCRAMKTRDVNSRCLNHDEIFEQRCRELLEDNRLLRVTAKALDVQ